MPPPDAERGEALMANCWWDGDDSGAGFDGKPRDATVEEVGPILPKPKRASLKQLPDTSDDKIGSLLARARAIKTWTKERHLLLNSAIKAMEAAKYVTI